MSRQYYYAENLRPLLADIHLKSLPEGQEYLAVFDPSQLPNSPYGYRMGSIAYFDPSGAYREIVSVWNPQDREVVYPLVV
jgi:hypothetical protein